MAICLLSNVSLEYTFSGEDTFFMTIEFKQIASPFQGLVSLYLFPFCLIIFYLAIALFFKSGSLCSSCQSPGRVCCV